MLFIRSAAPTLVAFTLLLPCHRAAAQAGPVLNTPESQLLSAISCTADVRNATFDPVLLVHGTAMNAAEAWGWGYRKVLPQLGVPVCTVDLQDRAVINFTINAEYVVYAIRHVHQLSGRKVSVIGHSQGGTLMLWALRYWPDIKDKVDDVISLAGATYGTALGQTACALHYCAAVAWQARLDSNHFQALHRQPMPAGPSYTMIASYTDEVVLPQPYATHLSGAANFMVQDFCPLRVADHLMMAGDNVAFEIALDALLHDGPADRSRLHPNCWQGMMPGSDPIPPSAIVNTGVTFLLNLYARDPTWREPALPYYAR